VNAWSSALSVDEFAAIRSAGFEPVGQVMGTAVYRTSVLSQFVDCGYRTGMFGTGQAQTVTTADGDNGYRGYVRGRTEMRRLAMDRMARECQALGGSGVVATRLTMGPLGESGNVVEYRAIGTAVAARGVAPPERPFLSHLTGQEFAQLFVAGWVPVDLVLGIAVGIRHDDWATRQVRGMFGAVQEVGGWTELVSRTRAVARTNFHHDAARRGGDGLLVSRVDVRVWDRECRRGNEQSDHGAEAMFLGTSIAAFHRTGAPPAPAPLTIMPLDRASGPGIARSTHVVT
jgi:uncharacterized protein YbjQ (UPF0145 family)